MNIIFEEGYAGSILFSLFDEWFKYSWNTQDIEVCRLFFTLIIAAVKCYNYNAYGSYCTVIA